MFFNIKIKNKNKSTLQLSNESGAGFTIIELIIAIFILSVAIVGIFSALSIMIILTSNASDRLTASYLAQEGLEIVRNIRDTNWLNMDLGVPGANWSDNLTLCEDGCQADYTTGTGLQGSYLITPYQEDYLNSRDTGFYYYDANSNTTHTKFKRKITITFLTDYVVKVSVQVFWDEKPSILNPIGAPGSIQVEETLFDWYNYTTNLSI